MTKYYPAQIKKINKESTSNVNVGVYTSYNQSNVISEYNNIKQAKKLTQSIQPLQIKPTVDEYKDGYFNRYFLKKITDNKIFEIDKKSYDLYSGGIIDKNLYTGIKIIWKITGKIESIQKNELIIELGVEDFNKKVVQVAEKEFNGLLSFISKNYIMFWKNDHF
ncbi:MAG: hypothetical protein M0R17_09230 [Candidatus Omnitrophica bacterium]|jgi:hypothetical protein|nr:hypothetical protein [Candidatus Omnitrophota bacterium]